MVQVSNALILNVQWKLWWVCDGIKLVAELGDVLGMLRKFVKDMSECTRSGIAKIGNIFLRQFD